MMSPPQASSQVWGIERVSQMSRKVAMGCRPPIRVTFIPKPSHEAGAHDAQDRREVLAALVEIDGVGELAADRGDLLDRVAGLLEDERDVPAGLAEQEGVPGGQAAVAVHGEPHPAAHPLPDLAHHLDVDLDRPTADLDLEARIALVRLLRAMRATSSGAPTPMA